jgi:formylglycine-generating enzyme required for sulfatase activity
MKKSHTRAPIVNWKAKVAGFVKQIGPGCKFAAKLALGTMIPVGGPAVIELIERALDCASDTADKVWEVEKDRAAAADLERVGTLLEAMQSQMGAGLKQLAALQGEPEKARRILDTALANQAKLREVGKQLATIVAGFDRLEAKMDAGFDRLAGRQDLSIDMQHEMLVMQRLSIGLMLTMYGENVTDPERRARFRSALAALGEGRVAAAYPAFTALVQELPQSSAAQGALGVAQALRNDLPAAQASLMRATRLNPANPALQQLSDRVTASLNGQTPVADAPLRVGEFLDGWEVIQLLGSGGYGQVVKGRKGGETAALKVLHARLSRVEAVAADFRKEMMALMRLGRKRHLAEILEFGFCEQQRRWYFVTPFVDGMSLQTYLERHGPLSLEEAVNCFRPVAEELGQAHALGISHWDIKPANLLRAKDGSLTLVDFGLAGAASPRGTTAFAAPEQLRLQPAKFLSDVYSLAATFYYSVTREAPENFQRERIVHVGLAEMLVHSLGNLQMRPANATEFAARLQINPVTAPKPGEIITNSLDMKFAWIPPGTFSMGSPKDEKERQDNETHHKVTLSKGFFMGVHAVTQEQWQAVMGSNPSKFKGDKNLPVELVSWENCQEFIKKLRDKDKKPYRLPTESEWEYACRAGTKTPFCFGETISTDQANYDGSHTYGNGKKGVYRQKTTPVGSFPANAWGLFDMHGNVWEWCHDWHGDYPQNDVVDPQGPSEGQYRVLRGGSWYGDPEGCRSACRDGYVPANRYINYGLRVCFCLD